MLGCALALAQNPRGALRGEVLDASGYGGCRAVLAESEGSEPKGRRDQRERRISFEGLLPGAYHVTVAAKGFAEASADVTLLSAWYAM
jgi:hypothetical protein